MRSVLENIVGNRNERRAAARIQTPPPPYDSAAQELGGVIITDRDLRPQLPTAPFSETSISLEEEEGSQCSNSSGGGCPMMSLSPVCKPSERSTQVKMACRSCEERGIHEATLLANELERKLTLTAVDDAAFFTPILYKQETSGRASASVERARNLSPAEQLLSPARRGSSLGAIPKKKTPAKRATKRKALPLERRHSERLRERAERAAKSKSSS